MQFKNPFQMPVQQEPTGPPTKVPVTSARERVLVTKVLLPVHRVLLESRLTLRRLNVVLLPATQILQVI